MTRSSVMQNKFRWYRRCIDNSGIAHPHGISLDRNNTRSFNIEKRNKTQHKRPNNAQFRPAESETVRIIVAQRVLVQQYNVYCIAHPGSHVASVDGHLFLLLPGFVQLLLQLPLS